MAQLIVRNLEDDVAEALRKLAAEHGHSSEEEHRVALRSYVQEKLIEPKKKTFTEALASMPYFKDDPEDLFEI